MIFRTIDKFDTFDINTEDAFELSHFGYLMIKWRLAMHNMLFCFTEFCEERDRDTVEEMIVEIEEHSDFVIKVNDYVSVYSVDEREFAIIDLGYTTGLLIKRKDKNFFENYIL